MTTAVWRAGLAAVVLAAATACSTSAARTAEDSAPGTRPSSPTRCVGARGTEQVVQGQSHPLPDGAAVGIASLHLDTLPPTVRLALGNVPMPQYDQETTLGVGDKVDIGSATYQLVQICAGSVSLNPVH